MTIKFFQIFIISTLLSYIILISVSSDISIIQYRDMKSNNTKDKSINLQIEQEISELQIEIEQLKNNEQLLDLAFELGYVNTGDKIYKNDEINQNIINTNSKISNELSTNNSKEIFNNWEKINFFILSLLIGIAISLCYLLISKKMEK